MRIWAVILLLLAATAVFVSASTCSTVEAASSEVPCDGDTDLDDVDDDWVPEPHAPLFVMMSFSRAETERVAYQHLPVSGIDRPPAARASL